MESARAPTSVVAREGGMTAGQQAEEVAVGKPAAVFDVKFVLGTVVASLRIKILECLAKERRGLEKGRQGLAVIPPELVGEWGWVKVTSAVLLGDIRKEWAPGILDRQRGPTGVINGAAQDRWGTPQLVWHEVSRDELAALL